MPTSKHIPVKDLSLDLSNFRTMRQDDEVHAVETMLSSSPDWFLALIDSLIDDGYLPTENILVLRTGSSMVVKEGNRRVAALKIIHGHLTSSDIPAHTAQRIADLSDTWKVENKSVPCTIYDQEDASVVDRIITLAHGKGEKAGREQWNATARARHNRDVSGAGEPALDLLEKYLKFGKNRTPQQAARWAGDYPLTVLDEAIKRISTRFGVSNAPELAKAYPKVPHRDALENILKDIGLQVLTFTIIRKKDPDFGIKYGVSPETSAGGSGGDSQAGSGGGSNTGSGAGSGQSSGGQGGQTGGTGQGSGSGSGADKTAASAIQDPQAVKKALKKFQPLGNNRQKVVTLRDEAYYLNLKRNPIAFCFVLRSMFEISAKAYCDDHKTSGGPSCKKANGQDRSLEEVLRDITKHLTKQNSDKEMVKVLHGAMAELGKKEGILSVTSMNQLVHNPAFSVTTGDICTLFGNVFPLLEAMNR